MAKHLHKSSHCGNCNFHFLHDENFCPNCGQDNHIPNLPIGHLFLEFLESIFHFDTKIWTSLKHLICYPGLMTKEFLENKRMRFVPPIRLYIFISVIYFLFLNLFHVGHVSKDENSHSKDFTIGLNEGFSKNKSDSNDYKNNDIDSSSQDTFSYFNIKISKAALDSYNLVENKNLVSFLENNKIENTFFNRILVRQTIKAYTAKSEFFTQVINSISKNASMAMFFIMPIFALLLKLLFLRHKKNYYEFLIFSIHFHTAIFIFFIILILYYQLVPIDAIVKIGAILAILYFYKSLRTNYLQSKLKTAVKTMIFFISYSFVLVVSLIILFIFGLLFT